MRFNALVVALWTIDVLVKRAVAVVLVNSCRRITSGLIFARGVIRDPPSVMGDTCAGVVGKVTRVAGVEGEAVAAVVRSLLVVGMSGVDVRVWVRVCVKVLVLVLVGEPVWMPVEETMPVWLVEAVGMPVGETTPVWLVEAVAPPGGGTTLV